MYKKQLGYQFPVLLQIMDSPNTVYAISMNWFRQWQSFIRTKSCDPPGPIDNSNIVSQVQQDTVKPGSDYAQISEELWIFFHHIYGGGPEVKLRSSKVAALPQRSQSVTAITSSHFENLTITGADSVPEFFIPSLKPKKHAPVFDATIRFDIDKDIAPVHEPKVVYTVGEPKELTLTQPEISPDSVTLEIVNTNINVSETLPEEIEPPSDMIRNDIAESTDDVSVTEFSQNNEVKQRRNKRRMKCKKIKNKPDVCEGKALPGTGDK